MHGGPDRVGRDRSAAGRDQDPDEIVRQAAEYAAGHVPGVDHIELGDLATRVDDMPAGPVAVMCAHGERAMTATSVRRR
jgi:hypothetical protein